MPFVQLNTDTLKNHQYQQIIDLAPIYFVHPFLNMLQVLYGRCLTINSVSYSKRDVSNELSRVSFGVTLESKHIPVA